MTSWNFLVIEMTSLAKIGIRNNESLVSRRLARSAMAAAGLVTALLVGIQPAGAQAENDFPTVARADYVFACMASNGQTQEMLYKCSCSIDAIAGEMSYDQYVQAETIIRMRSIPGENAGAFRDATWTQEVIDVLNRAQADAELQCF